jgi:site-specific DNA-methyltransferase (adenine-specific)
MAGRLYCGDNLEVLPEYIPRDSVDLIYLDPPFNSQRNYNLIYKDSKAQEVAFKDYWSWEEAASTYARLVDDPRVPKAVRNLLQTLHGALIENDSDQLAYLTMMTPRLVELHRVLKPTGSMYLHCDPTASHYLKIILDALFGGGNFQNEIVWRRTNAKSATGRWPRLHDIILFYSKGDRATFSPVVVQAQASKLPHTLITGKDGLKYQTFELTAPNLRFGETGKPWRGFQPAKMGRCWSNPPSVLEEWDRQGLIHWPKKDGAWPRRRAAEPFKAEARMVTVGDVWDDIDRLNQTAKERLGYPTQKPLALMDRIIQASSRPGDLVLDAFCGCGTTVESAERLGRRWIGVDVARKAIEVIERRFKNVGLASPDVVWHPTDQQSAEALAARDKRQFEKWALRKVRAARQRAKDRGIDGEAIYREPDGTIWHVLVSVKGGILKPADVRDLRGTVEREGAPVGVLLTMNEPTKEMRLEAARAGFLKIADKEGPIPRLQLVTVERVFSGLPPIRIPGVNVTEMPKPSVPPPPGVGEQLSLNIEHKVVEAKRPPAKATPRAKGPAKTRPYTSAPEAEYVAAAERTRSSRPPRGR